MRATGWLVLLAGVAPAASSRPARACSCAPADSTRILIPASGTTGFPVDGKVRVFLSGFDDGLRARLGEEYRLRGVGGALVPIDARVDGTMLTLAPRAPLAPRTRYAVERVHAYTEKGERLTDSDRWSLAERRALATEVTRRWYPDGWFVTGDGPEARRPEAPVVDEARVELRQGGGDCGPATDVSLWYRPGPAVAATDVFTIERQTQGPIWHFPPLLEVARKDGRRGVYAGNNRCASDQVRIDAGESYAFRLVAITAAGARVPGPWVRALVKGSPSPAATVGPRAGGLLFLGDRPPPAPLERWFGAPLAEAGGVPRGPQRCPWGFETTAHRPLSEPADPCEGLRPPLSLGWRAGNAYVAFADPSRALGVVRWPDRLTNPFKVATPVDSVRALFSQPGPLFAVTRYAQDLSSSVELGRWSWEGTPAWIARFDDGGAHRPVLLASGRNVLVCWPRDVGRPYDLLCAVAEGSTGRVIRPLGPVPRQPRGRDLVSAGREGDAALAVEGGFLIAWTMPRRGSLEGGSEDRSYVTRLDERGNTLATSEVPGEGGATFALGQAGRSVALIRTPPDGLQLVWLDLRGKPRGAPVRISAGTGPNAYHPTVAARPDVVAVAWESTDRAHAIAITEGSSPSVAFDLGGEGLSLSGPTIAAAEPGFVVTYVDHDGAPHLERLACRTSPAEGAPARVVTAPPR